MKTPPGSAADFVISAEKHADIVRALRGRRNARGTVEAALQFFSEGKSSALQTVCTGGGLKVVIHPRHAAILHNTDLS